MSLPLLLETIPASQRQSVIDDAIEHFGLDRLAIKTFLSQTKTDRVVIGYATECFLANTTPDLDDEQMATLARLVSEA